MIEKGKTYKVVRTLPRRGELYAVTSRRSNETTLKRADRNFTRDKRRVLVALPDEAA